MRFKLMIQNKNKNVFNIEFNYFKIKIKQINETGKEAATAGAAYTPERRACSPKCIWPVSSFFEVFEFSKIYFEF